MTTENINYSKTLFTFSKKEGQNELAINLINNSENNRNLNVVILESETRNILSATIEGNVLEDIVTIPAKTISQLVINTTKVNGPIVMELSQTGGGISMRQRSSSSGGMVSNLIDLMLK
ncbi:hypothetical protein [Paenibacillus sp. P36]|uniref:hypothetical protein n=1 Tax=Paenibacillus sp. P36 TaxID=3342538 RepID=UPI0038B2AA2A